MAFDTFCLIFLAIVVVGYFLDKIGDARVMDAETRRTEMEARLARVENDEARP